MLDKNQSALLTNRNEKQSLYILLSSLVGSIIGVMGGLGFIMRKFEKMFEKILHRMDKKKYLEKSINNRIWLNSILNDVENVELKEKTDKYSVIVSNICDVSDTRLIPNSGRHTAMDKSNTTGFRDSIYLISDGDQNHIHSNGLTSINRSFSQTTFRTSRNMISCKVHPID